jgi:beta-fructofuranosidase
VEDYVPLSLPDKWLWDFWFAKDGDDFHLFYLQALRSLENESLRHWNVSVGHAVSQDLIQWSVLPDALGPSEDLDAFDNCTTWTGSIIRHEKAWFMFYTGTRQQEQGLVQRIGVATSEDLITWSKHPENPVIEADPTWYELLDREVWHDQAWRDPWIFQHPQSKKFHALITARSNYGPPDGRGVIGHAESDDLITWQVRPPLTEPGKFGHLEVPQLVQLEKKYYLVFSVPADKYARDHQRSLDSLPVGGSHYLVADHPLGPFTYLTDHFFLGDPEESLYSTKLIQDPEGQWVVMAFKNYASDRSFIGELADPLPLTIESDGTLSRLP